MSRETCKFFSGAFAALGYAHAAYAVATSSGVISEPVFLGRKWGVGYMWTEAVLYTAISVGLGYLGWGRKAQPRHLHLATASEDGVVRREAPTDAAEPAPL